MIQKYLDFAEEEEEGILDLLESQCFSEAGKVIIGIRCAAHTLQLAIEDALKKVLLIEITNIARRVWVKLRTTNIRLLLKDLKLPMPKLDFQTRYPCFLLLDTAF